MKAPKKLHTLAELGRRFGVSYKIIYKARKRGLLNADFVDSAGRALFNPSRVKEKGAVDFLRSILSATDFEKVRASLRDPERLPSFIMFEGAPAASKKLDAASH